MIFIQALLVHFNGLIFFQKISLHFTLYIILLHCSIRAFGLPYIFNALCALYTAKSRNDIFYPFIQGQRFALEQIIYF